jgi:hypothetical protein
VHPLRNEVGRGGHSFRIAQTSMGGSVRQHCSSGCSHDGWRRSAEALALSRLQLLFLRSPLPQCICRSRVSQTPRSRSTPHLPPAQCLLAGSTVTHGTSHL